MNYFPSWGPSGISSEISHLLYNCISNRVLNKSALNLWWLHLDSTFPNFLQTFYSVKILLKSRQMPFVAFYLIDVCNHQNTFIKMWSCLWEHTKFTSRKWRILFSEVLGWEENLPPLFKYKNCRKKNRCMFAASMDCCLLVQFSFCYSWQHKLENTCVGSSASMLSTHDTFAYTHLLILICPALHFFCIFLELFLKQPVKH